MSQKRENILNLALETDEQERARTENLNVGFSAATRSWELIAKYHGDLRAAAGRISVNIFVEELIAGYAILTVPEELVDAVTALEEVEYLEKPKRFFYSMDSMNMSIADRPCFAPVTLGTPYLSGQGVLILVADSGIDWKRRDFQNAGGRTRIRYLWDQTLVPTEERRPPEGFRQGVEFDAEQINAALSEESPQVRFELLPSIDVSGHGTAVAGIAAGSNAAANYLGAAPNAELLIVKLGVADEQGFPRTTELMRAVTWGLRRAVELQMPLVVNLSFGNCYGAHDGSSLLERFLDNASEIGRTVICVGSGNEGASAGHVAGNVYSGGSSGQGTPQRRSVEISVANYERNLRVQLWQNYSDEYRIEMMAPGGRRVELTAPVNGGKFTVYLERTKILAYQGEPTPYAVAKELYLEFLPDGGNYITGGIWTLVLTPVNVVTGQYYLYLSDSATRNAGTFFYSPTPQVTLTIPSTASKVITVGAYDAIYDSYADFSGRGYADRSRTVGVVAAGLVKPDFVAPGVDITAPDLYEGYTPLTGTSFATPIAAGAAALLMEWGIVRGNDPFLYGEKVKAYLRKGAGPLRGETELPNDRVGFGAMCLADSLPE
ncbi:MAG: S8 family serine peptidase [Clostridium sp.]|nr:S8 family serine peptidase [Acetatifactor muris]MCM1527952.1 S8 family serine peptidase [Bacteroides sp.]MCM1564146.1 S8 family serine peptidase [Clostridium sp.]